HTSSPGLRQSRVGQEKRRGANPVGILISCFAKADRPTVFQRERQMRSWIPVQARNPTRWGVVTEEARSALSIVTAWRHTMSDHLLPPATRSPGQGPRRPELGRLPCRQLSGRQTRQSADGAASSKTPPGTAHIGDRAPSSKARQSQKERKS